MWTLIEAQHLHRILSTMTAEEGIKEVKVAEKTSPIKYFLSGGFGGVCTVVAGHPLDTIKVSNSVT